MTTTLAPLPTTVRTWTIDKAHSNVEFAVRHLMISTVKGRFSDVSGTVTVDESNPSATTLDITIPTVTIDTRQSDRDAHLRSADFLDVEHYPTITFKGHRIDGDLRSAFRVVGNLTIHGVTREITLEVTAEGQGPDPMGSGVRAGYSAKAALDRRDFGLLYNMALETGGVVVGHDLKISIDLELLSK
jgi:polyisoprenoid-binding protein YceI